MEIRTIEGSLIGTGLKLGLVVSRFNGFVSEKLVEGAVDALVRHGVAKADIELVKVPGAFDLPLALRKMASSKRYDALVALGAVIRGGTPHFDYVAGQAARGVAEASWQSGIPVTFGILTCDTIEQAVERAGMKAGNKGADAAVAAIEMAQVCRRLSENS